MINFIGKISQTAGFIIPLFVGAVCSFPFAQIEARGDRGHYQEGYSGGQHHDEIAAGGHDGHGHDGHGHEGYDKGYEHGYNHGYEHGYNHGYRYGYDGYVGPGVGVGVGIGLGGVGVGGEVNVYENPVEPVYYAPEPGVNINIGN